jgi:hypothetical protein
LREEQQNTAHKLRALDLIHFYFNQFKDSNRVLESIPILFEYLLHYSIPNQKQNDPKSEKEDENENENESESESESKEIQEEENDGKQENNQEMDENNQENNENEEEDYNLDDYLDESDITDDKYRLNPQISKKISTILVKYSKKDSAGCGNSDKQVLSKVFYQVLNLLSICDTPDHQIFLNKYYFPVLIFLGQFLDKDQILFFSNNSSHVFKNIFTQSNSQYILERMLVHFPSFSLPIVESLVLFISLPTHSPKDRANFFDIIPHVINYTYKSVIYFFILIFSFILIFPLFFFFVLF